MTEAPARPALAAGLARFACGLRREDIGGSAAEHVSALILDAVGCALAGWAAQETPGVLRTARGLGGDGRATIIGADTPASLVAAVLANAYLTTAVTACDVYIPSHCHLTPEVVPAALAVAEAEHASGPALPFEAPDGGLFASYAPGDAGAALAELGRDRELEQISIRLWPGATGVQALLTALLAGGRPLPVAADLVSVDIRVPPATYQAHRDLAHPGGTFEALLSFHYVAAATILHGRFGIDLADPAVCAEEDITKFIDQRVSFRPDPAVPRGGVQVAMHTRDGEEVVVRQDHALGTPQRPATPAQVQGKFLAGASARIGPAAADALLDRLRQLDNVADCADLLR